jgi:AraC-like DNA-binding protein
MSRNRHPGSFDGPLVPLGLRVPLFGLAEDRGHHQPIPPHRHDAAQLIHAVSGVMTVRTEDGLWVVPPARAVWVPAFVTHSIALSGHVQLRTIYLSPEFVRDGARQCCVVQVTPLLRAAILRAVEFGASYADAGPEANVATVIRDEIEAAPVAPLHMPIPTEPRARRVADAFMGDVAVRRTRTEWARVAGASERTLERLFHAETGMSFGRWQRQIRLLRALERLADGHSVTAVALDVGFETPSAFISMFRRALGTTPARYFQQPDLDDGRGDGSRRPPSPGRRPR